MTQKRWIKGDWGVSENNRRAKFYSLTPRGSRQLAEETDKWARTSAVVARFVTPVKEDV